MDLKPGSRWKSAVCSTEAVVVRPPSGATVLECGGHPMLAQGAERPADLAPKAGFAAGSGVGKRYLDEDTGLERVARELGLAPHHADA